MAGGKAGIPRRCSQVKGRKDTGDKYSCPGVASQAAGTNGEKTKAVVQVRVRVQVTLWSQVQSRAGIGTCCCSRGHTTGQLETVSWSLEKGPVWIDEAGNTAPPRGPASFCME